MQYRDTYRIGPLYRDMHHIVTLLVIHSTSRQALEALRVTVKPSHRGIESVSVFSDTVKSYLQTTSCTQYSFMKTHCTAVQSESQH